MKHNFSKSNAATGKTALYYLGASVLNDVEIPIYGYNATSINDILEHMCDMCVNHVKNGRPVYTFNRFNIANYNIGVGLSLHCIDGDTSACLYIHSDMKSDLGEVRKIWGDIIHSYLLKRGIMRNKGFAKRVKKHEITVMQNKVLTAGFLEEKLTDGFVFMN